MFLCRRMQCRSATYLLFASSSKFSCFLQCYFLIFLDWLAQEIPVVLQEKHIHLLCFVTLLVSQFSVCRIGNTDEQPCICCSPSSPKMQWSILFCLGLLFCWRSVQLPSHPFFFKCQKASAAFTAPESLWHFGVTGLDLLSVLILFDFQNEIFKPCAKLHVAGMFNCSVHGSKLYPPKPSN